jgi:hypothetical protein
MAAIGSGPLVDPDASVTDLLQNLNLTAEEEDVAEFSDNEDGEEASVMEWALVGKVLSPVMVHVTTIYRAMKSTWGNPYGLKVGSIGEKEENLFVVEFGAQQDMEQALGGSPWMVGRHALLLLQQHYDERLKPSEIKFDRMDIWVRILNFPLGWMNRHRGQLAMSLIDVVKKLDVDKDWKASGPFLRA